jgi:hypothetical protein
MREVANSLCRPSVRTDYLLDGDDTPLPSSAIQHRREDFIQRPGDIQDGDCLAGAKRLIHQTLGMLGIAESRVEYSLGAFGNPGHRQSSAFPCRISAGCEDDTILTFRDCLGQCAAE